MSEDKDDSNPLSRGKNKFIWPCKQTTKWPFRFHSKYLQRPRNLFHLWGQRIRPFERRRLGHGTTAKRFGGPEELVEADSPRDFHV